jgi:hypothetical protein
VHLSETSRWHSCALQVLLSFGPTTERRARLVNPGDFPLGSHQSRAAARAMLANRQAVFKRREVIFGCAANDSSAPHATKWHVNAKEQTAGRVVSIPEGMTLTDGLRMLGGYSEGELEKISASCPEPVNIGSLFVLRR